MAEIDDGEYQQLQALKQLHGSLYGSAEHGLAYKKLLKQFNPKLSIPEVDIPAPYEARIGQLEKALTEGSAGAQKEIREFLDRQKQIEEERDIEGSLSRLAKDNSLTEEGVEKVKKMMVDRKIADPEAAVALFLRQMPAKPARAAGFAPKPFGVEMTMGDDKVSDESMKFLTENPERWFDQKAEEIWAETSEQAA